MGAWTSLSSEINGSERRGRSLACFVFPLIYFGRDGIHKVPRVACESSVFSPFEIQVYQTNQLQPRILQAVW